PGVYQRGSRWVAVYRQDGRQRKEFAATFREAREIKIRRSAEEASRRAGPTLHSYALEWVDHYAGRGANDVINDRTRREYRRLLEEIPDEWRPLFELLASTGLRISEAIALRMMDADLDQAQPRIHVRRAIVNGQLTGPKSRYGRRTIPISRNLARRLAALAADRGETELLFVGARGATLRPGNLRYRVVIPAADRAGVPSARCHTLRQTCA